MCKGVEHYGFPVDALIPACECDKCDCIRSIFDDRVNPPVSCSCRSNLILRMCRQRLYGGYGPLHSENWLAAMREMAQLGAVEPLARISDMCEMLLPFHDDHFLQNLNEPQLCWLLSNNITVGRAVSNDMVKILDAKGFHDASSLAAKMMQEKMRE